MTTTRFAPALTTSQRCSLCLGRDRTAHERGGFFVRGGDSRSRTSHSLSQRWRTLTYGDGTFQEGVPHMQDKPTDDRILYTDWVKDIEEPLVQHEAAERAAGFTQVSNVVLRGYPELSAEVKLTYMVLSSFAYTSRKVFPGLKTLGLARDLRPETMSRHLHELQEAGLIEIMQRGRCKTNIYILKQLDPERVLIYLEQWGKSDLRTASSHSGVTCVPRQVTEGGDLRTASSPVVKEDEGTYEEDVHPLSPGGDRGEKHTAPEPSNEEKLAALRDGHDPDVLELIDEFLENAALENKSKRITPTRRIRETRELLELLAEVGEGAWLHGMRAANKACAPSLNYVKKAATSGRGSRFDEPPRSARRLDVQPEPDPDEPRVKIGWEHL